MIPDRPSTSTLGVASLVTGIVEDVRKLIAQHLSLFRSELHEDLGKTRHAAIPLIIGVAVCLLAGFFLGMTLVRVLVLLLDLPEVAALAIVAVSLAIIGAVLVGIGAARFSDVGASAEKAIPSLKETPPWKNQK